jgi:hypothetical protein
MKHGLGAVLVLGQCFGGSAAALSAPLDCEKLKTTLVPFQITYDQPKDEPSTDGYFEQVYRDTFGLVIRYAAQNNKFANKIVARGPFVMQIMMADKRISQVEFDGVDPFKFDIETKFVNYQLTLVMPDGQKSVSQIERTFVDKGTTTVGPCEFSTVHWRSKRSADGQQVEETDIQYSPELQTYVWSKAEFSTGSLLKRTMRAQQIDLDFSPIGH